METPIRHILIVEDDPILREMARTILELAGYEVSEAADGGAALALIEGVVELPDLIVTDLMMPVMNGRVMIGRLRSEPRTAGIPIIVLSANADAVVALKDFAQPDAVMRKPYSPRELVALVRSLEPAKARRGDAE